MFTNIPKLGISKLKDHLGSKSAKVVVFNFISENELILQSSNNFILETTIGYECIDKSVVGNQYTVLLDKSFNMFKTDNDSKNLHVAFYDNTVVFKQAEVEIRFKTAYDKFIETNLLGMEGIGTMETSVFKNILSYHRSCIPVKKSLVVGDPAITIVDRKVYVPFSNFMFSADISLPLNLNIPFTSLHGVVQCLNSSKVNLFIDQLKKTLVFSFNKDKSKIYLLYKDVETTLHTDLSRLFSRADLIGEYSKNDLLPVEDLFKLFPKESIIVNFYKGGTIGFNFEVVSEKSIEVNVLDEQPYFRIKLSIAQLESWCKIVKNGGVLTIWKGEDVLWCKSANCGLLTISGMIF